MDSCLPDWNIETELQTANLRKQRGSDNELVELLWQNGQVVLHSQTHRRPGYVPNESRQVYKHNQSAIRTSGSTGNPTNLIQDEETISWVHCPVDDTSEKDFYSNFLFEVPSSNPVGANKPIPQSGDGKFNKLDSQNANHAIQCSQQSTIVSNPLPPPRFGRNSAQQIHKFGGTGKREDFHFPIKADMRCSGGQTGGPGFSNVTQGEVREHSALTRGSSHCGSNQVANDVDMSWASSCGIGSRALSAAADNVCGQEISPQSEGRDERETLEQALMTSSGGSGSSFGRTCNQSAGTNSNKRKSRDAEDSECQSDAVELKSAPKNKKSGSIRKSRAAEVHNLSERRRRDRINEKMRALQELIPNGNKSDKASMLDEAIEYMKALQLQLQYQMMWMGSGMSPMMFPGMQNYASHMGMGIAPPMLPTMHNPMHLSRLPLVDQAINVAPSPNQAAICQMQLMNPVAYQNPMQNPNLAEQYANFMGFQRQNASQPINMFGLGPHPAQQNYSVAPSGSNNRPFST